MKYSLWLVPPEPVLSQLNSVINELAVKYSAPKFEAHLTLVSDIEIALEELKEKAELLAAGQKPLNLSLGPVSFSNTYFQSVLVRVNSTAELMDFNLKAKDIFGLPKNFYMPHMSLLYGDHDMTTREKISAKLNLPPISFGINTLTITPATPNTQEWTHLADYPLAEN